MKKIAALCLILAGAGALSAQSVKVGGGGNFTANFNSYAPTEDGKDMYEYSNSHLVGGGVFAFFDVTYLEFNTGLLFGVFDQDKYPDGTPDDAKQDMDITALRVGLFGKVPIAMGAFTLFPMLGIEGQLFIDAKHDGDEISAMAKGGVVDAMNQFWFKAGVGLDIPLSAAGGKVFLRPEFLYGIRLNTDSEKDHLDDVKDLDPKVLNAIIGHGLDLKFAIGYSF